MHSTLSHEMDDMCKCFDYKWLILSIINNSDSLSQ